MKTTGDFHFFNQENGSNGEELSPKEQELLNKTRHRGEGAPRAGMFPPLGGPGVF